MFSVLTFINHHISPQKRGLEQICLPFDLTNAITPAVTPAQRTEDKYEGAFRPDSTKKKKKVTEETMSTILTK